MNRPVKLIIAAVFILAAATLMGTGQAQVKTLASLSDIFSFLFNWNNPVNQVSQVHKVSRIIDGDTIELENGQIIRYIGIDTPELNHKDEDSDDECFARSASLKNTQLVSGKYIFLEKDISETDKYGRLLRYVYAGDQPDFVPSQANLVNLALVRTGFAHATPFPPDVKMQIDLEVAEKAARNELQGLWSTCL